MRRLFFLETPSAAGRSVYVYDDVNRRGFIRPEFDFRQRERITILGERGHEAHLHLRQDGGDVCRLSCPHCTGNDKGKEPF
jgi:hypothetical protein